MDSEGFFVRINADDITEAVLDRMTFSLEIICNVPILIFQFPHPYQITMVPIELAKNFSFGDFRQLRIRLELTGKTNRYEKQMMLNETDSSKIRQCQLNLPKKLNFGQAVPV